MHWQQSRLSCFEDHGEKSSLENSIPELCWILTIFAKCALSHLYETIKRLMNYHKQTQRERERKPEICSLCFSQFPFNLTHAFVLSLKAPFALMASLFSFTQWQCREEASSSRTQLPKVQCWKYIYTLLNSACEREALEKRWRWLLLSQKIYSGGGAQPSSQRHNQSPQRENHIFPSTEKFGKRFNSLLSGSGMSGLN